MTIGAEHMMRSINTYNTMKAVLNENVISCNNERVVVRDHNSGMVHYRTHAEQQAIIMERLKP